MKVASLPSGWSLGFDHLGKALGWNIKTHIRYKWEIRTCWGGSGTQILAISLGPSTLLPRQATALVAIIHVTGTRRQPLTPYNNDKGY